MAEVIEHNFSSGQLIIVAVYDLCFVVINTCWDIFFCGFSSLL